MIKDTVMNRKSADFYIITTQKKARQHIYGKPNCKYKVSDCRRNEGAYSAALSAAESSTYSNATSPSRGISITLFTKKYS